jgi:hypothetical protein
MDQILFFPLPDSIVIVITFGVAQLNLYISQVLIWYMLEERLDFLQIPFLNSSKALFKMYECRQKITASTFSLPHFSFIR